MSAYWHIKALMIYEGQIVGHKILGFTWACFCSTRSSVYIHTGERKKSCLTKYLYWLFLDEKIMGFYIFFSIFAKIYIIRCCFYQHKNGGYKNRIDKDNLEGSQLCATCKRFHLKISRKHNSRQILRASGCFLPSSPALHIESVFSSCWMVKFITSLPACFRNLPSVFLLTCWGFTKTLVLSKAWRLGTTSRETWNFYCFSSVFLSPDPPCSLCLRTGGAGGTSSLPTLCQPPEPRSQCDSDGSRPGCDLSLQVAKSLLVACLGLVTNEEDLPSI